MEVTPTVSMCYSCKAAKDIVYTDAAGLGHCAECVVTMPMPSVARAMNFLAATIPFRPGDVVECRLAGEILEGVGEVDDISFDLEHGGSPVYPAFHVKITDKLHEHAPDEGWYPEVCLAKVDAA